MEALPARTDVVVIGGGYAGCATAWTLAQRGVSCVVLEREASLGRYASGRGAGLGRQLAESDATTALTVRGAELLRTTFRESWHPTGGVLGFDDEATAAVYQARAARFGVPARLIDRAAVLAAWPTLVGLPLAVGLEVPSDGAIDARRLLDRFAAGAPLALGTRVERLEPGGAGAQVVTSRGVIEARIVVDAAGPWAGALTGDPPLAAFKRHLFVLEVAPQPRAPFLWHLGASELYVRDEAGGTLACACDAIPCSIEDPQVEPAGELRLRAVLGPAAPAWADAPLRRQWACMRAFTPDRTMRLGRDPDRPWLVWAAGLGGHGATASGAVGERVADAVIRAL